MYLECTSHSVYDLNELVRIKSFMKLSKSNQVMHICKHGRIKSNQIILSKYLEESNQIMGVYKYWGIISNHALNEFEPNQINSLSKSIHFEMDSYS